MTSKIQPLPSTSYYLPRLGGWLALKAAALTLLILYGFIGLGPDEAQYWTWSRSLDWGYYSKPPGIAWQIWLGTALFGQSEWGVRSLAVFMSFIQGWLIFFTAVQAGLHPRTAYWSALMMAFSPIGILGSLFATTDGGVVMSWSGACLISAASWQRKESPDPLYVGGWVFLGLLFKWTMGIFWIFYLAIGLFTSTLPKAGRLCCGILLSLTALLPSIWWNSSHDWATFRHVSSTLQGGSMNQAGGNLFEFIGSQALLVSPILFVLLLLCLPSLTRWKDLPSRALLYFGIITFTLLFGALFCSLSQKVQGNWIIFAYPTAFILIAWFAFEQRPTLSRWAIWGVALSIVLCTCLLYLGTATNRTLYRVNSLKHNLGWRQLQEELKLAGYDPKIHFLASDKYQTTSELSFYSEGQKRAYFINIQKMRNNQFSYWPSIDEVEKGHGGFFVWTENSPHLEREREQKELFYERELPHYFEKVHFLAAVPLITDGKSPVKMAFIYWCENPKETLTQPINLW